MTKFAIYFKAQAHDVMIIPGIDAERALRAMADKGIFMFNGGGYDATAFLCVEPIDNKQNQLALTEGQFEPVSKDVLIETAKELRAKGFDVSIPTN